MNNDVKRQSIILCFMRFKIRVLVSCTRDEVADSERFNRRSSRYGIYKKNKIN